MGNELLDIQPNQYGYKRKQRWYVAQTPDGYQVVFQSTKPITHAGMAKAKWGRWIDTFSTRPDLAERYAKSYARLYKTSYVVVPATEVSASEGKKLRKIQKETESNLYTKWREQEIRNQKEGEENAIHS